MVKLYGSKHVFTPAEVNATHDLEVDIPNIDPDLKAELESRIKEFEKFHELDALNGGNGWVERIKKSDFLTIGIANLIWFIWWLISVMK